MAVRFRLFGFIRIWSFLPGVIVTTIYIRAKNAGLEYQVGGDELRNLTPRLPKSDASHRFFISAPCVAVPPKYRRKDNSMALIALPA